MGFDYLGLGIYQSYSDTLSHWALAAGTSPSSAHWSFLHTGSFRHLMAGRDKCHTTNEMGTWNCTRSFDLVWNPFPSELLILFLFSSCPLPHYNSADWQQPLLLQESTKLLPSHLPNNVPVIITHLFPDHALVMDITSNSFLKLHHFKVDFPITRVKIKSLPNYYINQYQ